MFPPVNHFFFWFVFLRRVEFPAQCNWKNILIAINLTCENIWLLSTVLGDLAVCKCENVPPLLTFVPDIDLIGWRYRWLIQEEA